MVVKTILGTVPFLVLLATEAGAQPAPTMVVSSPAPNATVVLGQDQEQTVDVVVAVTDFTLKAAGQCGGDERCGHLHLKIDPSGDSCNIPGRGYNSMNSDVGGNLVKARFAYCDPPTGAHVIGVLLAHDNHQPVMVDGKPVTALVPVIAK
jgi:hypothetical protein